MIRGAVIALLFLVSGCGSNIIGVWRTQIADNQYDVRIYKDGGEYSSFILDTSAAESTKSNELQGSYSISENTVRHDTNGPDFSCLFSFTDPEAHLILQCENDSKRFVRVQPIPK